MRVIELDFHKDYSGLSGKERGKQDYKDQVMSHIYGIGKHERIGLIFPPHVEIVSSSWVQGFFSEKVGLLGYNGVKHTFVIESEVDGFEKWLWDRLY